MPRDQCEDLAQEAWLRAFARKERFRGEHALSELCSWLAIIVRHLAVDTNRHERVLKAHSLDALAEERIDVKEVERAEKAEWSERLTVWLARLQQEEPDNCWLVCQRYLEGRTIGELADEGSRTARVISNRIWRAIQKMHSWAFETTTDGKDAS